MTSFSRCQACVFMHATLWTDHTNSFNVCLTFIAVCTFVLWMHIYCQKALLRIKHDHNSTIMTFWSQVTFLRTKNITVNQNVFFEEMARKSECTNYSQAKLVFHSNILHFHDTADVVALHEDDFICEFLVVVVMPWKSFSCSCNLQKAFTCA